MAPMPIDPVRIGTIAFTPGTNRPTRMLLAPWRATMASPRVSSKARARNSKTDWTRPFYCRPAQ
ncbi:hypothetical protein FHG66_11175 [Rubellimicrobium rubrum]|uniref:Uncharacterized protein n=1 Tax=Rubellimicrobium rubrum TaxID=2585369 RepID=A0A5C4MVT5_9RHOB|nr:hypothetical protein FHG66_11175 [Rubellimicrobium rubrum]